MRLLPRVLIVEDDPAIAELISVNLVHNGFTPSWAQDGESAQRELEAELPDLILLDWTLPGESGLRLARRWRADPRTKRLPIVMLTARDDERDKVAALEAGADDYVTKPFSAQELLARIRAVMRRSMAPPAMDKVAVGGLVLDTATYRVTFDGQPVGLGPREFKLLHYLMANAERVRTRSQVLEAVWDDNVQVEERTVDVHIKRLRRALGNAGAMIETVRGAGYCLRAQPPTPP
jgi:two-component system phosphate regulon response regulator PhoB